MKTALRFMSLLIFFALCGTSIGADVVQPGAGMDISRAIAIADGSLGHQGRPSELELVTAKLYSTPINEITKGRSSGNDDLSKNLVGKTYWMIYYRSRTSDLGGDVGIFVDATDGRVIHIYRGK